MATLELHVSDELFCCLTHVYSNTKEARSLGGTYTKTFCVYWKLSFERGPCFPADLASAGLEPPGTGFQGGKAPSHCGCSPASLPARTCPVGNGLRPRLPDAPQAGRCAHTGTRIHAAQACGRAAVPAGLSCCPVSPRTPASSPPPTRAPSLCWVRSHKDKNRVHEGGLSPGRLIFLFCLIIKPFQRQSQNRTAGYYRDTLYTRNLKSLFEKLTIKPPNYLVLKPAAWKLCSLRVRFGGDFWQRDVRCLLGPAPWGCLTPLPLPERLSEPLWAGRSPSGWTAGHPSAD